MSLVQWLISVLQSPIDPLHRRVSVVSPVPGLRSPEGPAYPADAVPAPSPPLDTGGLTKIGCAAELPAGGTKGNRVPTPGMPRLGAGGARTGISEDTGAEKKLM